MFDQKNLKMVVAPLRNTATELCQAFARPGGVLRLVMSGIAALLLTPLPSAAQNGGLTLATARQCMACHQVDQKRVGPAFALIRERFLGDAAAIPYLVQSIRQGGRGRWGVIPMPAQPQVSENEAVRLAQWILGLEPE